MLEKIKTIFLKISRYFSKDFIFCLSAGIFFILLFFGPLFLLNKALYPFTLTPGGLSLSLNAKNYVSNHSYLDNAASDWVEIPFTKAGSAIIKGGELPLWSPYNGLGTSLIGNINSATFAPFGLVLNFWNSPMAWEFVFLARLLIGGVFMFLFLRRLGLDRFSSVLGMMFFLFNGYSLRSLNMFYMNIDMFLPALFYCFERLSVDVNYKNLFFSILAAFFLIIGGNPQPAILGFILSLVFFIVRFLRLRWNEKQKFKICAKSFLIPFSVFVSAVILAAFLVMPFIELFQNSYNYHGSVGKNYLPPNDFFGAISFLLKSFSFASDVSTKSFKMPYIGVFAILLLSQLNLKTKNSGWRGISWLFVLWSVLFILKIFGFSAINWIGNLFLFEKIFFYRYVGSLFFSISVLLAFGADSILKRGVDFKKLFYYLPFCAAVFIYFGKGLKFDFAKLIFDFKFILWNILYFFSVILFVAAPIALLILYFKNLGEKLKYFVGFLKARYGRGFFSAIIVFILIISELLIYHFSFNWLERTNDPFVEHDYIKFLKSQDIGYNRVYGVGGIMMPNQSSYYKIYDVSSISGTQPERYWEFMYNLVLNRQIDLQEATARNSNPIIAYNPFLSLLNVKYVLSYLYLPEISQKSLGNNLELVYDSDKAKVYENRDFFPRAFLVGDYKIAGAKKGLFDAMYGDVFALRSKALFLKSDISELPAGNLNGGCDFAGSIAEILEYKASYVKIKTNSDCGNILVLSDLYYPGWKAYVDGAKAKIYPADYIFRSVFLEKGSHIVEFVYTPLSFKIGSLVSLSALAILMFLFFIFKDKSQNNANQ